MKLKWCALFISFLLFSQGCEKLSDPLPNPLPDSLGTVTSVNYGHYCTVINTTKMLITVPQYRRVPLGVEIRKHGASRGGFREIAWSVEGREKLAFISRYER